MIAVFDGHNDVLTRKDHARFIVGREGGHVDLPRMAQGGMRGGIFAVFSPSATDTWDHQFVREDGATEVPYAEPLDHMSASAHATVAAGRLIAAERDGHLRIARDIADIDAAFESHDYGRPVAVLHLEGAEAIDPDLEALDMWYAAGLRSLGPVWGRANAFATGVQFVFPSSPDIGPGLTDAGIRLVERCAELGILVDLSHLNEAGFWDVARLARGPLVATHSGVHALCPTSRNLTDAQLDAIGASNGLIGIVFAVEFLRPDFAANPDTPLSLIVDHARYVRDRIGIEHVALGSDFDGAMTSRHLADVAGLPRLLDALRAGGFNDEEINRLAWVNWRRVLDAWWR